MRCFPLLFPRAGDEILQKGDLYEVVEALLEAKDKAYELGLRLKLSPDEVKSISNTHQDPQDRLTAIIEYLLKQVEPRPTWRLIVNAVRSPLVGLPRLAEAVEAAHCPNSTTTNDVLPETPSGMFAVRCKCKTSACISMTPTFLSCPGRDSNPLHCTSDECSTTELPGQLTRLGSKSAIQYGTRQRQTPNCVPWHCHLICMS